MRFSFFCAKTGSQIACRFPDMGMVCPRRKHALRALNTRALLCACSTLQEQGFTPDRILDVYEYGDFKYLPVVSSEGVNNFLIR